MIINIPANKEKINEILCKDLKANTFYSFYIESNRKKRILYTPLICDTNYLLKNTRLFLVFNPYDINNYISITSLPNDQIMHSEFVETNYRHDIKIFPSGIIKKYNNKNSSSLYVLQFKYKDMIKNECITEVENAIVPTLICKPKSYNSIQPNLKTVAIELDKMKTFFYEQDVNSAVQLETLTGIKTVDISDSQLEITFT